MQISETREQRERIVTESVINEVVEGVAIAVVSELVVGSGKLLEALKRYGVEIAAEFRVLCQNHSASCYERVDQRLLPHLI